ncbi:MAG TPA: TIGR02266 family protein, partial [Thermoanaerobaculia bacterium]|nr:TIGR02266 family protein [Thermoanaerobaculia bacterium]
MSATVPSPPRGPFDQREGLRVDLRRRVSLKFKDFRGFVNEYLENLSPGGMFIRTTAPPPVGTVFDFELTLEDYSRLVHGLGEVAWVREKDEQFDRPAGMGVRFLRLEPESRELIDRVLAQSADPSAPIGAALAAPALDTEGKWWEDPPLPVAETAAGGGEEAAGGEPVADGGGEEAVGGEPVAAARPIELPEAPSLAAAPSPYTYARSYRGAAVARTGRRPRPLLVILLVVVVLVALAAAGSLLFPDVAVRLLLGRDAPADLETPQDVIAVVEAAADPVTPVLPSEAAGGEGSAEPGEPEIGFFEPPAEPSPAPVPSRPAAPPPADPTAGDARGAARTYSQVLNVIWEPAGEELTVTVFLDGTIGERDYSV